jgi:hypothetical protein
MCLNVFRPPPGHGAGARTVIPGRLKWRGKHWSDEVKLSYPGEVAGGPQLNGCSTARKPGG